MQKGSGDRIALPYTVTAGTLKDPDTQDASSLTDVTSLPLRNSHSSQASVMKHDQDPTMSLTSAVHQKFRTSVWPPVLSEDASSRYDLESPDQSRNQCQFSSHSL